MLENNFIEPETLTHHVLNLMHLLLKIILRNLIALLLEIFKKSIKVTHKKSEKKVSIQSK